MIEDIKAKAKENKIPIIKDGGLSYLLEHIKKYDVKDILELGTAVGYSSINMAKLNKDIHIDTIEKNKELSKEALANIENEHLSDQISVYEMAIEDFKTSRKYDLIFVDAAKAQYGKYLEMFIANLKDDGCMIFDNMIFHGMIYDVDSIKNRNTRSLVKKIIRFRENVLNDNRFDIIIKDDIGDGILVLRRSKDAH